MKSMILQTTDNLVKENIVNIESSSFSLWLWVALVELLIIIILLLKFRKKENNLKFGDLSKDKISNAKKTDIDMGNLMNSINGSKDLYKELSKNCHPDRFVKTDKQEIAEKIFQEISKHKRDFNRLNELKQRAINELNIKFK